MKYIFIIKMIFLYLNILKKDKPLNWGKYLQIIYILNVYAEYVKIFKTQK